MCNHHLKNALRQVGFKKLSVDECVWYWDKTSFFYYTDNGILMGPEYGDIERSIEEVERSGLEIEYKGNIEDYLSINVKEQENGNIKLTQPQIIDSIINDAQLPKNTAPQQTPAMSTKIPRCESASPTFNKRFNYLAVVVNLNFLEKITRPDIAYATHECAHFYHDPRASQGDAIIHLVKHIKDTKPQGIALEPEGIKLPPATIQAPPSPGPSTPSCITVA